MITNAGRSLSFATSVGAAAAPVSVLFHASLPLLAYCLPTMTSLPPLPAACPRAGIWGRVSEIPPGLSMLPRPVVNPSIAPALRDVPVPTYSAAPALALHRPTMANWWQRRCVHQWFALELLEEPNMKNIVNMYATSPIFSVMRKGP
jgi:hypothetical protein